VDRFVAMGFDVEQVVASFEYVGIDKMGGEDYELEEAYMGDITARLFGEAWMGVSIHISTCHSTMSRSTIVFSIYTIQESRKIV
jgi:hypothetical protein